MLSKGFGNYQRFMLLWAFFVLHLQPAYTTNPLPLVVMGRLPVSGSATV